MNNSTPARAQRAVARDGVALLRSLVAGVRYMHALGIVHRDIKMENVLFADESAPVGSQGSCAKIVDFGAQFEKKT